MFNAAEYDALRAVSGEDVSLLTSASATHAQIAGASYSRIGLEAVDGGLFPMLGVAAAAGRLLTPADDNETVPVAVLGFRSAVRYFGSAAEAVGQPITLQGHSFTIVGVLPRKFRGLVVDWPMSIVVTCSAARLLRNSWNPNDTTALMLVTRLARDSNQRRHHRCQPRGDRAVRRDGVPGHVAKP